MSDAGAALRQALLAVGIDATDRMAADIILDLATVGYQVVTDDALQRYSTALAEIAKCPAGQLDPQTFAGYVLDGRSAEEIRGCFRAGQSRPAGAVPK